MLGSPCQLHYVQEAGNKARLTKENLWMHFQHSQWAKPIAAERMMVFDRNEGAQIINEHSAQIASAGLSGDGNGLIGNSYLTATPCQEKIYISTFPQLGPHQSFKLKAG